MTLEHLQDTHAALRPDLPGGSDVQMARSRALAQLISKGWPDRKQPHWHYSNVPAVAKNPDADFTGGTPATAAAIGGLEGLEAQFLLNAGVLQVPQGPGRDGASISSLAEAWSSGRVAIGEHAESLVNFNAAFALDGAWIRTHEQSSQAAPLYGLIVDATSSQDIAQNRIRIDVAPKSQLSLILHFGGTGKGWSNTFIDIEVGEGAELSLTRLQTHSEDHHHSCFSQANVAAGAALRYGCFDLGARFVHNDLRVELTGSGGSADVYGLFVAAKGQHLDTHVNINHQAPETKSQQEFRGIAATGGRGIYNGGIRVAQDAQRIEAHQNSDNLLLGPRAEIDTKPELEIYADDVKCSHGATVGELDANAIYYLRTRGLDLPTARELLTVAFAETLLEQAVSEPVRQTVRRTIVENLGEAQE